MSKEVTRADAAVIGSGASGAVVAAVLAEAGLDVVVLEEGVRANTEDFNGDVGHAVSTYYRNGGAIVALGEPPITVQVGCVVGGSTVINGGTSFRTPDDVLSEWSSVVAGAFEPEEFDIYFERVERDLNIVEVAPELAYAGERRLLELALSRGERGGYVKRNAHACQGTGLCPFGCPTGAKQSVEQNYIPRAEKAGARVLPRTRAERILVRGGKTVGVRAQQLPTGRTLDVQAERVFLCAGAMHSPLLLRKSLGGRAPSAIGQHLTLHPAAHVAAVFPKALGPREGPMQSIFINAPDESYMIFGMSYQPELLAALTSRPGGDISRLDRWDRSVSVAVMASDHNSEGRVRNLFGQAQATYNLDETEAQNLVRGMAHAAELLFELGAEEVYHGVRSFPSLTRIEQARAAAVAPGVKRKDMILGSVHPMGTCRMGLDPRTSVLGPDLQVHGVQGLYVPDASSFPTSLGVNPQVTIMAFAMKCAEAVVAGRD